MLADTQVREDGARQLRHELVFRDDHAAGAERSVEDGLIHQAERELRREIHGELGLGVRDLGAPDEDETREASEHLTVEPPAAAEELRVLRGA